MAPHCFRNKAAFYSLAINFSNKIHPPSCTSYHVLRCCHVLLLNPERVSSFLYFVCLGCFIPSRLLDPTHAKALSKSTNPRKSFPTPVLPVLEGSGCLYSAPAILGTHFIISRTALFIQFLKVCLPF